MLRRLLYLFEFNVTEALDYLMIDGMKECLLCLCMSSLL